jgi:Ser/Thr protein kinase RdoA (MazF antagonist)
LTESLTPSSEGDGQTLAGAVSIVVRLGSTLRRSMGPWTPAVHALLRHLERAGFDGAPRALGHDEQGREVLSFVEGQVASGPTLAAYPDATLFALGHLIRRMHTATEGFSLPDGVQWYHPPVTDLPGMDGAPLVVCHNDLSPGNTVLAADSGGPIAFIDWDLASLAPAVWDLAQAAWQFIPLAPDAACAAHGWATPPDRRQRLRTLLAGYGLSHLSDAARRHFAQLVALRIERTASGIERLAQQGEPAFIRFVELGAITSIRADGAWVAANAAALIAAAN